VFVFVVDYFTNNSVVSNRTQTLFNLKKKRLKNEPLLSLQYRVNKTKQLTMQW